MGQTLSGDPYNPLSTVLSFGLGAAMGAAVGWVPGAAGALGPGLDQGLVQALIGGPSAMALGVGGSVLLDAATKPTPSR